MSNVGEKRAALFLASLSAFLTSFMASSINIALPAIGREFQMGAVLLGWVPTSYILVAAMFLIPFGRLADIHGRKRVFICGIGTFTLSSLLLVFSQSAAVLIALRVVQGFGGSMIFGTGMAILTSVFPVAERGRALGINIAAVYLGLSLGPSVGGVLTGTFGWRSIFLMNVPLGLLALYLVLTKLKQEWAEAHGEAFDVLGAFLYSGTLAALVCGLSFLPARSGVGFIATAIAGSALFLLWERKTTSPLLNTDLFIRNTVFAFSNLAALINYSATFAVTFLMSLYLQHIKGFSPQYAGLILVSQPVIMALFSPLAGRLSDTIEPRIVASLGMGFTATGIALFTLLDATTPVVFIVAGLVLIGFGFALFSSPNTNAAMSSIEKRYYSVGSATLGAMRMIGQMLSMGITMLIFSLTIGSVRITPEQYPQFLISMKTAFSISALLCFSGIFASLARGKMR